MLVSTADAPVITENNRARVWAFLRQPVCCRAGVASSAWSAAIQRDLRIARVVELVLLAQVRDRFSSSTQAESEVSAPRSNRNEADSLAAST
jgi:hypothetical protein